jgi:hypothetical protein
MVRQQQHVLLLGRQIAVRLLQADVILGRAAPANLNCQLLCIRAA